MSYYDMWPLLIWGEYHIDIVDVSQRKFNECQLHHNLETGSKYDKWLGAFKGNRNTSFASGVGKLKLDRVHRQIPQSLYLGVNMCFF